MKSLSRNLLMGAVLAALPMSGALACTVTQWNGAKTAVDGDAQGPETAPVGARYSGLCALNSASSASYVGDNHPVNDPEYTARFYVYTGLTSGSAQVFGAYSADDGSGAVVDVTYDRDAGSFDFDANGASGSFAGVQPNRWYSIEIDYSAGTSFAAEVAGAGSDAIQAVTISGTPGATNIESARLGWIAGAGAGSIRTDEFESTRGVAIGRLCRGDANADTNLNVFDRTVLTNEILGTSSASGQPDMNEDGAVNVFDRTVLTNAILGAATCP
ncbi:MAG: dockerin type I domain-containing protein [Lysobacteraceae bacterium]